MKKEKIEKNLLKVVKNARILEFWRNLEKAEFRIFKDHIFLEIWIAVSEITISDGILGNLTDFWKFHEFCKKNETEFWDITEF